MNSLVGSGTSSAASRAESVISSSGMSDSETGTTGQASGSRKESFAPPAQYGPLVIVPMVDIRPPAKRESGEKEVVMYSKEVQTSTVWAATVDEDDEREEEVVKRRVDEEVRKEIERLQIDEERTREEEEKRLEAEKDVPGIPPVVLC